MEGQVEAAEAAREARARPVLSAEEMERQARERLLLLSRSRLVSSLEAARDARYREMLERSLAHVDAELAEISKT